jgi:hypothetical protein
MNALELARPELLWALCALPLVWLLHWVRGRPLITDRLEIWERALRRLPRHRRKRIDLRLLLSLLTLSVLVLASAGPRFAEEPGVRVVHAVVDCSASMWTADGPGGMRRIEAAQQRLANLREELPERIALRLWALEEARIRRVASAEELSRFEPQVGAGPARTSLLREFVSFANDEHAVLLLGDGAGASRWPASLPGQGFGAATRNDGILAYTVEDPWPGPNVTLRLRLLVRNEGSRLVARDAAGGELAAADVPPGRHEQELQLPRLQALELRLEPADAYPIDDAIALRPKPALAPLIWAVAPEEGAAQDGPAPGSPRQSAALVEFLTEALGGARATSLANYAATRRPRLWIQDGGELQRTETEELRLFFGTRLPGLGPLRPASGICEWRRDLPLLEGLDLSGFECQLQRRATREAFGAQAQVLATLGGEPFVVLDRERRQLWFGCRLQDGNLLTQPSLPILVLRALGEMLGAPQQPSRPRPIGESLPESERFESDIAARPAPLPPPAWRFFAPARELWRELLLLAAGLLLLRGLLR